MRVESETSVKRPASDVFEYIAHAEYLPDYVTDFASVRQASDGEPGRGTQYSYKMSRGGEGSFEWTTFEPTSRLAWHGPAVKAGPGSMEPSGWWEITSEGDGTRVKLVMAPKPGGLFKLLSPFLAAGMRKGNDQALERLKQRLEQPST
ncbi:MAG TPA: SRPBCC family protein [Solirubrobacteraceae bacterium]|nr:SRPBCC family protein [Solirubrobacteraceae bacterium]